jgi:hypothetical protein
MLLLLLLSVKEPGGTAGARQKGGKGQAARCCCGPGVEAVSWGVMCPLPPLSGGGGSCPRELLGRLREAATAHLLRAEGLLEEERAGALPWLRNCDLLWLQHGVWCGKHIGAPLLLHACWLHGATGTLHPLAISDGAAAMSSTCPCRPLACMERTNCFGGADLPLPCRCCCTRPKASMQVPKLRYMAAVKVVGVVQCALVSMQGLHCCPCPGATHGAARRAAKLDPPARPPLRAASASGATTALAIRPAATTVATGTASCWIRVSTSLFALQTTRTARAGRAASTGLARRVGSP